MGKDTIDLLEIAQTPNMSELGGGRCADVVLVFKV